MYISHVHTMYMNFLLFQWHMTKYTFCALEKYILYTFYALEKYILYTFYAFEKRFLKLN